MNLQAQFEKAAALAAMNRNAEAAPVYEELIYALQNPMTPIPDAQRSQLVRSVAFNLAQVFDKLGQYGRAIEFLDLGLSLGPTPFGRAIALAARGECLWGLNRHAEARADFAAARQAHPVIGALNAADSMARLGFPELVDLAEDWVDKVVLDHGPILTVDLRREVKTIRATVLKQRNTSGERIMLKGKCDVCQAALGVGADRCRHAHFRAMFQLGYRPSTGIQSAETWRIQALRKVDDWSICAACLGPFQGFEFEH